MLVTIVFRENPFFLRKVKGLLAKVSKEATNDQALVRLVVLLSTLAKSWSGSEFT